MVEGAFDVSGDHAVIGQSLSHRRYLEHTHAQFLERRIVEILDGNALVVAIGEHKRGSIQGPQDDRTFGI